MTAPRPTEDDRRPLAAPTDTAADHDLEHNREHDGAPSTDADVEALVPELSDGKSKPRDYALSSDKPAPKDSDAHKDDSDTEADADADADTKASGDGEGPGNMRVADLLAAEVPYHKREHWW
jgi:hypothetical protein